MNWNLDSLYVLGLTNNEIKVLNPLKEAKNVQFIAKDTKLSRTGINHIIKSLLKRGLIKKVRIGKRAFYMALDQSGLLNKIKNISEEININEKDKKGVKVKISHEDEFVIHVGAREIVPAYERIALDNKNERIKAIQHHKSWLDLLEKVSPAQLVNFNRAIVKNKLILDGMLNESAYGSYLSEIKNNPEKNKAAIESLSGRMADYTVFADDKFNYSSEIWLFKNTALIINWRDEVAIEITNENMTAILQDMFEFVKAGGRKIDHNKLLREILVEEKS